MHAHIHMHLNGIMCGSLLFQYFYLKHHSPWLSLNYTEWLLLRRALQKNHQIPHPAAHATQSVLTVSLRS